MTSSDAFLSGVLLEQAYYLDEQYADLDQFNIPEAALEDLAFINGVFYAAQVFDHGYALH
jgi:hypothetical protein